MKQPVHRLTVATSGRGLVEVTELICRSVATQAVESGLLTIWCRHTSASLLDANPDVRADLEAFFRRVVPEGTGYRHRDEAGNSTGSPCSSTERRRMAGRSRCT